MNATSCHRRRTARLQGRGTAGPLPRRGGCGAAFRQRLILWCCLAAAAAALPADAGAQQLLDRIVARVGATVITQTDVDAALALGVVEAAAGADRQDSATLQLVDRHLLLAEVGRFPPLEPPAADVDAVVARMRAHAGAQFSAIVERTGLDEQRLRDMARDTLRIQAYIDQRFGSSAQASVQEAREYYESHRQEFARNGAVPPFEQVEEAARAAASAERRGRTVTQWIADLRTRGEVVVTR